MNSHRTFFKSVRQGITDFVETVFMLSCWRFSCFVFLFSRWEVSRFWFWLSMKKRKKSIFWICSAVLCFYFLCSTYYVICLVLTSHALKKNTSHGIPVRKFIILHWNGKINLRIFLYLLMYLIGSAISFFRHIQWIELWNCLKIPDYDKIYCKT